MKSVFNTPRSAVFLLLLIAIPARAQTVENSLFWKISGHGLSRPSYLFGTYHLLNSSYLDEVPRVKAAHENASGVVVETELDSTKMMQLMPMVIMPKKRIADLMTKEEYKLVSDEIEQSTGMTMSMMAQFKPAFIMFTMTLIYIQQNNDALLKKYEGHPIDSYFASAARKKNKPVTTFETMEEQMAIVFDHDPVEEQARQLVEFIRLKDEMIKMQAGLTDKYMEQDLAGLYSLYKKHEGKLGDMSYLLDDRNVKWMEKLPAFLKKGNQFVAVGAMHLAGEKSLIILLRKAGYKVEPVAVR